MKARVTKHLNIRTGAPKILPNNNPGYYDAGDTIDIVDIVIGQEYKGNNVWYKLADSGYVWSGGVKRSDDSLQPALSSLPVAGKIQVDLPDLVNFNGDLSLTSHGVGGVVAILDSGISHATLEGKIIREFDFVKNTARAKDVYGHGTKVAGIIASEGPVIKGVSSRCSLINFRVADDNGVITSDPVFAALDALDKSQSLIDVINLSFDISPDLIPFIQPIINRLMSKGTVIVIAAGNNNVMNSIAGLANTIKVGAIDKNEFKNIQREGLNRLFHCVFVDTPIVSTFLNDGYDSIGHVSAYAAVVSGVICSLLREPPNLNLEGAQRLTAAEAFLSSGSFAIKNEVLAEYFKPLKP
jgi:subtilisin family serine protease